MSFRYHNRKNGLIYFAIAFLSFLSIVTIIFVVQLNTLKETVKTNTLSDIETYSLDINEKLSFVAQDLILLEEIIVNRDYFELNDDSLTFETIEKQQELEMDLLAWAQVHRLYDQVRVIGLDGNEVVRINQNNGSPESVAQGELQDKSTMYYFENSITLNDDTIYLSRIETNIENDVIEYIDGKPKEIIYIASPLYDSNDNLLGILIINYLSNELFHNADSMYSDYSSFYVVNEQGYFLHHTIEALQFGYSYDSLDLKLDLYYDVNVEELFEVQYNQNYQSTHLYSSYILNETMVSDNISTLVGKEIDVDFAIGQLLLFNHVDITDLMEYKNLVTQYVIMIILGIFISYFAAKLADEVVNMRKEQLKSVEYSENHDLLTGLPNRMKVFETLRYLVSRNEKFIILYADLDNFKEVNDRFGHDAGDKMLIESSKRIKKCIRETDIVSRLGGDEFLIVLRETNDRKILKRVSTDIEEQFKMPFRCNYSECNVGISIGGILSNEDLTLDDMIKKADDSMYLVKQSKK